MFWKKDADDKTLIRAKAIVSAAINIALYKNPKYAAEVAVFCDVVNGGVNGALADFVADKIGEMEDPYIANTIKNALVLCDFPDFDEPEQLEIIKEICSLVS